jgi:predicted nucleic acid-binding protein
MCIKVQRGAVSRTNIDIDDELIKIAMQRYGLRTKREAVEKLDDCLIAAVAIRNDVPVLHNNAEFDALARHTELQIA